MNWKFNGYMPMTSTPRQSIVNREPPNPPTSGSNAQKETKTRVCRTCLARIVGFYNGIGEWKYCPYCGAKLEKEKTENE